MTARPGPASPDPARADREQQIAAARERASKAPRLSPSEMARLSAILRAAGWARRPAPAAAKREQQGEDRPDAAPEGSGHDTA
jgi:hypothetical protein